MVVRNSTSSFEKYLYTSSVVLLLFMAACSWFSVTALLSVDRQRTEMARRYAQALELAKGLIAKEPSHDMPGDDPSGARFIQATSRLVPVERYRSAEPQKALLQASPGSSYTIFIDSALPDMIDRESREFARTRDTDDVRVTLLLRDVVGAFVSCAIAILLTLTLLNRVRRADDRGFRRLNEQHRKVAAARKGALLTISHDLQGPLQAVGLSFEFAQKQMAQQASSSGRCEG